MTKETKERNEKIKKHFKKLFKPDQNGSQQSVCNLLSSVYDLSPKTIKIIVGANSEYKKKRNEGIVKEYKALLEDQPEENKTLAMTIVASKHNLTSMAIYHILKKVEPNNNKNAKKTNK